MKSAILALAGALSLATASPLEARQTTTQSKPFHLVLSSANQTINGQELASCHEGAAIESLCTVSKGKGDLYQFNTTANQVVQNPSLGKTGTLTYALQGSSFVESEGMVFFIDPSTNVALPLFEPADTFTQVGFDKDNRMNVQSYLNDEVAPPTSVHVRGLYRWYVCNTNFEGYVYSTLAWALGSGKPENPSCQKVQVTRKFA